MFCRNCGKQIPDNSHFCGQCGWQNNHVQISATIKKKPKKKLIALLISVFAVILISTIAFFTYFFAPKQQAQRTFNRFAVALADEDYDAVQELCRTDDALEKGLYINERYFEYETERYSEGYEIISCKEINADVAEANFHIINKYNILEEDDIKEAYLIFYKFDMYRNDPILNYALVYKAYGKWMVDTGNDRW